MTPLTEPGETAALRAALDGLWDAYSHYAGAAEGAGSLQSRAVQRLVEAAYEVIVADKGHPGRLGRAVDVSGILAASPETTPAGVLDEAALRALSEAATPGPWRQVHENTRSRDSYVSAPDRTVADVRYKNGDADAALIVAAVNYVRAALGRSGSET